MLTGPCSPWIDGAAVAATPGVRKIIAGLAKGPNSEEPSGEQLERACAVAADAASEILYELSGRVFSGECGPVTIRPLARPTDRDSRLAGPFSSSWASGSRSSLPLGVPAVVSQYGSYNPPEVDLGEHPVTRVTLVKIDGVVIPSSEYELRNRRVLVRIRPTASSVPTERWGWPTAQVMDLPDTEQGTFSVTYHYGQAPPATGVIAAAKLAEHLVAPMLGDTTHYPTRVSSVTRQGVSAMVANVMDVLKGGSLGIYEVDAFLLAVNPHRNKRQAAVWSPDIGRARRTASPSNS